YYTGGGSGIGRRLAQHLASEGRVEASPYKILTDYVSFTGQSWVSPYGSFPNQAAYCMRADVTSWDDTVNVFRVAEQTFLSKVDFVFANAGAAILGFPNGKGAPDLTAAINHFRAHRSGGHVIVTASQASLHPFGGEPLYTASKHGVLGLVRATAMQVATEGIYINAVAPGSTSSNLMPKAIEDALNSRGWKVSKEKIMEAFDLLLDPKNKYSGQLVQAVGDQVSLWPYPPPSMRLIVLKEVLLMLLLMRTVKVGNRL
ncbi:NAD-binding protein, partial [Fomitopsis schrenkii]